MITCSRPECQTAAGCKCGRLWDYPVRLSMRTVLAEYTDAELWTELRRRSTSLMMQSEVRIEQDENQDGNDSRQRRGNGPGSPR